jgi:hypothetical protein
MFTLDEIETNLGIMKDYINQVSDKDLQEEMNRCYEELLINVSDLRNSDEEDLAEIDRAYRDWRDNNEII